MLFTGGVTEAAGEDFGVQRLVELIRSNGRLDAGALRRKILAALADYGDRAFQGDVTPAVIALD